MYFDMLTLAAIVGEIRSLALGGRVQSVVQPDALTVALEIFANGVRQYLLLTAVSAHPRVHFASEKPRRGTGPSSPFLLQLRKRLVGARLLDTEQPPWERILYLDFGRASERHRLVAEIMGRHSSLVLLDEAGTIVECVKRVGPDVNRYRVVLPNQPYVPPPAQDKASLPEWDAERLQQALEASPKQPLERVLTGLVRGLSPLAAREAVARAGSSDAEALLSALHELFSSLETGEWLPSVGLEGDAVAAYAPYLLTQFPEHRRVDSTSTALEAYLESQATLDPYAGARTSVREGIAEARKTLDRRDAALQRSSATEEEVETLLQKGQLLLAHASGIGRRQSEVTLSDFAGNPVRIALDSRLGPVENAQRYFKAYRKARAAAEEVPRKLEELRAEQAYLDQLEADLDLAETRPEIDDVMAALRESGYVRETPGQARSKPGPSRPLTFHSPEGFTVLVGHNSRQNEQVTFKMASPDDVWLHVRGWPGAHVIVRSSGRNVSQETLRFAAQLAAYYSAARDEGSVQVDWTQRKYVRHVSGGNPGMATYSREETLVVQPGPPEED